MRALKILSRILKALQELFMRGDLSRQTKSFQNELRLANWCINLVRPRFSHLIFNFVQKNLVFFYIFCPKNLYDMK